MTWGDRCLLVASPTRDSYDSVQSIHRLLYTHIHTYVHTYIHYAGTIYVSGITICRLDLLMLVSRDWMCVALNGTASICRSFFSQGSSTVVVKDTNGGRSYGLFIYFLNILYPVTFLFMPRLPVFLLTVCTAIKEGLTSSATTTQFGRLVAYNALLF